MIPEVETMISIQTSPKAVCFLYHDEATCQRLRLDADDRGIVSFHAKASKESKPIEMHLDCTGEDGKEIKYTIALCGDAHHRAPTNRSEARAAVMGAGKLYPPLEGDPMALSNEELLIQGYPPRPDPVKNPARYARWHRIISKPFARVNPRRVPRPEVSFSRQQLPPQLLGSMLPLPLPVVGAMFNANFNIWSGAYYTNPAAQFFWIQADWKVPGVIASFGGPSYSAVAEWIGLDNSETDLYQAGTDSECYIILGGLWTFTNYWMWIESLSFPPWAVPNFPISPGDEISVDIFVADQNGTTWFQNGRNGGLTPADNSIWFMLYNHTQGLSYWGTYPTAPETIGDRISTGFTGSTAEFIIERPSVNGSPVSLALFVLASMNSCWYGDSEYGDRSWQLGTNGSTPFAGNLTYINMLNFATNNLLALPISFPDPTSPGGYEILWVWANYQ
jgi:hypothetical protein